MLVGLAGHDEDRRRRRRGGKTPDRLQPAGIGKREVQQHRVEALALDAVEGFPQGTGPRQFDLPRGVAGEHLLEQDGVRAVVFHQEDLLGLGRHGSFSATAALSRKASMARINSTKPWKVPGFCR